VKAKTTPESADERALGWSISRLAGEFGLARETIAKRLTTAHVTPSGTRQGYPTYRLRDAVPAIFTPALTSGVDPRDLAPTLRDAWYRSESRRLAVETTAAQLIPAEEVRREFADFAKSLVQFLVTLPDHLERDAGLSPEQVDAMHEAIDTQREALAAVLTDVNAEPGATA
jgi:hypothetical protein